MQIDLFNKVFQQTVFRELFKEPRPSDFSILVKNLNDCFEHFFRLDRVSKDSSFVRFYQIRLSVDLFHVSFYFKSVALAVSLDDFADTANCKELALVHNGEFISNELSLINISCRHQERPALSPLQDRLDELSFGDWIDTS